MGMLFKTPKYTRPPEMDASQRAIEERDARASRQEAQEIRSIASRKRAMRGGLAGGLMTNREPDQLGIAPDVTPTTIRNPEGIYR
jgi:hypothetical protein